MKLEKRLAALSVMALLLTGCAQQENQADYIGIDTAKNVALEAAGVSAAQASFTTAGLDRRDGVDFYDVEFAANGQTYEYDIDAITGVVIARSGPETSGMGTLPVSQNPVLDPSVPAAPQPVVTPDPAVQPNPGVQPPVAPAGSDIGPERAKEIALTHAGLTADTVTFVKSHLDWEDGRQVYDVEFYTTDYKEYDYEIDAYSGEIRSYDQDAESYAPPSVPSGSGITEQDAKALALAKVPGATAKDIAQFKVDYDDGRMEYEGKIYYNGMEYEFEIDGYSGSIRSWEAEPIGY